MNKLIIMFIVINSYLSFGQEIVSINFNTGDKELNTHLSDINSYAKSNMDLFRKDMSDKFGVTREQLDQLITKERKEPADVYYGYNLAQVTGKPFPTVIKMHTDKKGWGAIAKDLGIKPGSEEFKSLKNSILKNIDKDKMNKAKKDNSKSGKDDKSKDAQKNKNSNDEIKKSEDKSNSKIRNLNLGIIMSEWGQTS